MFDIKKMKQLTEQFNVLFVEDDDNLRLSTLAVLNRLFQKVDTACHGQEGLDKYLSHKNTTNLYYDLIISDIQMPKMNGIEFSKAILKVNPHQKIIITSAYDDKEYLIELINIGVEGFFQKPIEMENMFNVFTKVCSSMLGESQFDLGSNYSFNNTTKSLYNENQAVDLTLHEQKLLDLFCQHPEQYFSPIDIFNHIYYDQIEKEFSSDSVKSLIKRLRKKIPENLIKNSQGLGYCIQLPN